MNSKKKQVKIILLLAGLLLVGLIVLQGCKESEPSGSDASQKTGEQKWTCPMHPDIISDKPGKCSKCGMDLVPLEAEKKPGAMTMPMPAKDIVLAVEQTTCPIRGGAIDKNVFVEYKGKKVYFCCPPCKEEFEKEPEKYIAKLPQFKN